MGWPLFLVVFLLSFITLTGEIKEYEPQEVATTEGLPSSIVNGSVCAISGEYIDSKIDIEIPGPETFVLRRNYGSFAKGGVFGFGWSYNHHDLIEFSEGRTKNGIAWIISYRQATGAEILFEHPQTDDVLNRETKFKIILPS